MKVSKLKSIIKKCFTESVAEVINEMYYFPTLNIQYYSGQNLKIPKLSQKYAIYYKNLSNKFYLLGYADDADQFDHYAYIIQNRIQLMSQSDSEVYTVPKLDPKDASQIKSWSGKQEVKDRREFERKNFPAKKDRDYWTGD